MFLDDINADLEKDDLFYRGICHDCGKHVEVSIIVNNEDEIVISGGALYNVKQGREKLMFFKCKECFLQDRILRNFQQCEVWSRVVGYLRPVQQWNRGKKVEYEMRKEFTNTKGL